MCFFVIIVGDFTGHYNFSKGFLASGDVPAMFQEKIDQMIEYKYLSWLEDVYVVAKGNKNELIETRRELNKVC